MRARSRPIAPAGPLSSRPLLEGMRLGGAAPPERGRGSPPASEPVDSAVEGRSRLADWAAGRLASSDALRPGALRPLSSLVARSSSVRSAFVSRRSVLHSLISCSFSPTCESTAGVNARPV